MRIEKRKVGHLCSVGIIYRAANPEELFFDIKDNTYPLVVWRGHRCLIGGNWTGNAGADKNPQETFIREVREELQLIKREVSTAELGETAVHAKPFTYKTKGIEREPTATEKEMLAGIVEGIKENTAPFGDYFITVPDWIFKEADPASVQTTQTAIISVFESGLPEKMWLRLVMLQNVFGNLSCESESHIMTIDEIIAKNLKGQAGQDQILVEFLREHGSEKAEKLPLHKGPIVSFCGTVRKAYADYFEIYDIERFPANYAGSR